VTGALRDREGALWIRTPTRMWLLAANAAQATDLSAGLPAGYDVSALPTGMAIGPRGNVLVATDTGLAYRERDHWRTMSLAGARSTPAEPTRTLLVDREGTVWIGASGLFQLRGRGLVEHHDATSGLPGDVVWTYQRDRQGTLWVGTNRCLARATAERWECWPGTEGHVVRSAAFPPQGGVFIGGPPSDLLYIDASGHATAVGAFDRPNSFVVALALGPEGDLWIGTRVGLYRLAGAVPGPVERIIVPGIRADHGFQSLAVTGGRLWTAAPEGIVVLDRGVWKLFDKTAGFRDTAMRYVATRSDGGLCVAYLEPIGLSCFRYDSGAISNVEHIGPAEGLTTGMVYFLGEDHQRRLWVGTGDGVDIATPHGIDHLDESDGLAGNDSSATAFIVDPDGSVWLGETGGATHVFAQYYNGPPEPPRSVFLDGQLGDRSIHDARAALEVPHDRNTLTLEFTSSSLLDEARVGYEVRLTPLETAWSATHQRDARYPALAPGTYRFEVRAHIGAGTAGPPATLELTVLPAWWQTRWFLALVTTTAALVIGAGFTWWLRRRTRRFHARSDASFRAVVDLMPDLISVYRDRQLIYLNLAHRRFLGIDAADSSGRDHQLIESVHPDDRARIAELFARVRSLEQPDAEVIEFRVRGADGSWRICEVSGILVEIGGSATVVASGRDVTERKRLRAKLEVSDRMASLGTLVAGIAHEINNPLAFVTGNLEAVAETLAATASDPGAIAGAEHADVTAAISDARDGAERVRKIVRGLRMFGRSEEERRVPLALPAVLDAAIRMTNNEVRHRAQLVREFGPTPLVVADDGRLTQVFVNLLINAAHAIPDGHSRDHRITVRTRTDEHDRAVIEFEDTGHGIAPDIQARVFDPFFTTKGVGGGTGLGLSICLGIVSGLCGQISIESSTDPDHRAGRIAGTGTIVRVVLPPATMVPTPPPAAPSLPSLPSQAAADGARHRILLVDDEPQIAHTMERLLRGDYDITIEACGQDALARISRGERFAAIVSDVMMPNMTGIELFEQLQRIAPDQAARVAFLTGGAFTQHAREQLQLLGVVQLDKPVAAKQLRACILRITSDAPP
jgi:PAS domain S-box-containing protein